MSEIKLNGKTLPKLVLPIVNLNGNSKESLVKDVRDIGQALRLLDSAYAVANGSCGHGRNFQTYPNGGKVATMAREAIMGRRMLVNALAQEIAALTMSINEQPLERQLLGAVFIDAEDPS